MIMEVQWQFFVPFSIRSLNLVPKKIVYWLLMTSMFWPSKFAKCELFANFITGLKKLLKNSLIINTLSFKIIISRKNPKGFWFYILIKSWVCNPERQSFVDCASKPKMKQTKIAMVAGCWLQKKLGPSLSDVTFVLCISK